MSGAIHPLPHYAFMVWCSVKAQGQLHLYLLQGKHDLQGKDLLSGQILTDSAVTSRLGLHFHYRIFNINICSAYVVT
jgi:hypothetical protein